MIFLRGINLTPRLMTVAQQIPKNARFADVGSDHGRLPVWLLEHGVTECIIATDLRQAPLERARGTARRHRVMDKISFRLGDGLSPVSPEETDTVAITGMGGETIAAILNAAPWTREGERLFLLQPMSSAPDLRLWLNRGGFRMIRESLVGEGETLYTIFTVTPGKDAPMAPAELWAGRQCSGMESPLRGEYLSRLLTRTRSALEGVSRSAQSGEKRREFEELLAGLTAMKEEWEAWQR